MNDKRLIELVRNYPVLYDLSNPKYMDTELKNTLWNKIGEETKTAGPLCKARWGNIRDNFRKSLKKTKTVNGQPVKMYKYSGQLSFLKKFFEERETRTNIDDEITNENVIGGLSGSEVVTQENQQNTEEYAEEANNPEIVESESPIPHDPTPTGSSQCFMARKKQKKMLPNTTPQKTAAATLMEYLLTKKESMTCPSPPPLHPVDAFLSGIAPALKTLPPHYWHYAKADIFAAVQKYELKMLMEHQQIPESPHSANCSGPIYSEVPSPSGSSHHYTSGDEHHSTSTSQQSTSQNSVLQPFEGICDQSTSGNGSKTASSTDRGQPPPSFNYTLQQHFHTPAE